MARLVIDLPENSPGCILFSVPGCGCPLPSGTAAPLVCGQFALSACEPEFECRGARLKNQGPARGGGDWSVLFASTRIWRAFGSPLSLG